MGVFLRKPTGKWCYEIRQRVDGKNTTVAAQYDFASQDDATLAWIEVKRLLAAPQTTRLTFFQAATARLKHLEAYTVRYEHEQVSKTFANNRARIGRFMEAWKDLPLADITKDMILERLTELRQDLTPSNLNKHIICLRAIWNHAIKNEMGDVVRNPAAKVDFYPPGAESEKVVLVPERDQVARVKLLATPLDRAYLTLVQYTAARVSEISKLQWSDVFWEKKVLRLWTRKTKGGARKARWISCIPKVMDALEYAQAHRVKNSPWVFTNQRMVTKYPDQPGRWRWIYRDKFLKSLCREAGVPEMGYHCLRHAAALEMAAKGISLTEIQKFLGHERATTTDIYLQRLGITATQAAAESLNDCTTGCTTENQQT
jgi:integrase